MCRRIVLRVVEKVQQQQQKGQEENQICWRRDITHNTYTGGGGGFYEHVSYPQLQKARHVGNGVGVSCHRGVLCWRLWQPHSIVCQAQLHSPALMMEMAVVAKISKPQFCFSVCIFTLWTIWLMTTMETITSKRGKHRLSKSRLIVLAAWGWIGGRSSCKFLTRCRKVLHNVCVPCCTQICIV